MAIAWPVLFFVVGLVFAIGFWLGHRLGFHEGKLVRAAEGGRSLTDLELMHLESLSVEELQRADRVPAPPLTLSRPARSRAKSA